MIEATVEDIYDSCVAVEEATYKRNSQHRRQFHRN